MARARPSCRGPREALRRSRGSGRGRPRRGPGGPDRRIFGFLGPNGAGKSTTVRMLTTLLTITSGRAEVLGVDVARDPDDARRRIGVALRAGPRPPPDRPRAAENFMRGCSAQPARRHQPRGGACSRWLSSRRADRVIKGYSGGCAPARPRCGSGPRAGVLFLDEPTTGLDPASRLTIWEELRRINQNGTTVFLTRSTRGGRPALRPSRSSTVG